MKYRHFKGGLYEYVGTARNSETMEPVVVYKNSKGELWVRPSEMFWGSVEVDGKIVPRFEKVTGPICVDGDCGKPADWVRCTQFAGDHPYCDNHAHEEDDFQKEDSCTYWIRAEDL